MSWSAFNADSSNAADSLFILFTESLTGAIYEIRFLKQHPKKQYNQRKVICL
jgi:hypothetical protein